MRNVAEYVVAGERVPSVTEVLDVAGLVDYRDVPRQALDLAAARGQEVHHWIEVLDEGGEVSAVEPSVLGRLRAYQTFRDAEVFRREWSERTIVSQLYHFAGRPDLFGRIGGASLPAVIDVKPPGPVQPWWPVQVAGYAIAIESALGIPYVLGFVLELGNDGRFKLRPRITRDDRHDFLAALRVAQFRLRHGMARMER